METEALWRCSTLMASNWRVQTLLITISMSSQSNNPPNIPCKYFHHLWDASLQHRLSITANTDVICFHNFHRSCADMSRAMWMDQQTEGYIFKLLKRFWAYSEYVTTSWREEWIYFIRLMQNITLLKQVILATYIPVPLPTAIEWLYVHVYHEMVTLQVMVCQVQTSSQPGKPVACELAIRAWIIYAIVLNCGSQHSPCIQWIVSINMWSSEI